MVYNLTISCVAEIVPRIVASVAINVLEFQIFNWLTLFTFGCLVAIRSWVTLARRHELVSLTEILFIKFSPLHGFDSLNFLFDLSCVSE
jgi:hypothetical protein